MHEEERGSAQTGQRRELGLHAGCALQGPGGAATNRNRGVAEPSSCLRDEFAPVLTAHDTPTHRKT
jgi:hypothetical protein